MSRTLQHRPIWVWFTTPALCNAVHDHRRGPCDLPDLDAWLDAVRAGTDDFSCRWEVDLRRLPPTCGCALCTGAPWRREDRRRDRHRARLELRRGDWRNDLDG